MGIPSQEQVALLTDYDVDSSYSRAYHALYASIRFNWERDKQQHTILLTTPTAYTGQAEIVANIAIAAAQSGTPTILVDADFSAPTLQQRFGVSTNTGLSNLLAGEQSIDKALCKTFVPHLRLLCTGSVPQEAHLLFSTKLPTVLGDMDRFLAETEHEPNIILFHGPAVLTGTDSAEISMLVEQTFLTIVSGRTTRRQAKQAQEQLERAHAKLAGTILLGA